MTEKVLMNDVWLTGSQNGGCFSDSKTVLLQQTERGNEAGHVIPSLKNGGHYIAFWTLDY